MDANTKKSDSLLDSMHSLSETHTVGLVYSNPYLKAATADNTRLAYQSDIKHFERWGGLLPASTDSIILYLQAYAATLTHQTLSRRLTALKQWHHYQGFNDPTSHPAVRLTLKGMVRVHGRPIKKAHPITIHELAQMASHLDRKASVMAIRDKAILQIGYFGALRESEIVGITVENCTWAEEGVTILLTNAKTDNARKGQKVSIPYGNKRLCPVTALKAWLEVSRIKSGVIFRQIRKGNQLKAEPLKPAAINHILKKIARNCCISTKTLITSHSMRRGITTEASHTNSKMTAIMRHGRWKNINTVLEYIDEAERFKDNVASSVLNTINDNEE